MDNSAWYVVQTNTGAESDVRTRLSRLSYPTMLPSRVIPERRNGQVREVERLMMPGYVFVLSQMQAADWHVIRHLPEVLRILGSDRPTPLNAEEQKRILWLDNGGRAWGLSRGRYDRGRLVITDGPLAGREADVIRVDARTGRARILAGILGESRGIDLGLIIERQPEEAEG